MPLYQCSGYSRLVCGGCPVGKEHSHKYEEMDCNLLRYCATVQDQVKCEPVEEENTNEKI